ncbi:MAG: DUF1329 domain-containing protein [bacterium]
MRRERSRKIVCATLVSLALVCCTWRRAGADVSPGDVIDKTNWEKAEGLLPDSVLNWVKKGDFVLTIGDLDYAEKDYFTESALKSLESNKGRYEVNADDVIVDAATGKVPDFIEGIPFPEVDLNDPRAGQKLLYNKHYHSFTFGGIMYTVPVKWIGRGGFERQAVALYMNFPMDGYAPSKLLDNPDGIERYTIISALEPYDISGFALMLWRYRDEREDVNLAYVPAIRRVRRMSPANRSDSWMGCDLVWDDAWGFDGKVGKFKWKVLRSQETLVPYTSRKVERVTANKRGEWETTPEITPIRYGYETNGWGGAPWAPVSYVWVKKRVHIIEAVSKDPYYNYGKQEIWFDPDIFSPKYKIAYDRSGTYWKTYFSCLAGAESEDGKLKFMLITNQMIVDERTQHASICTGGTRELKMVNFANIDLNDFTLAGFQKYCK